MGRRVPSDNEIDSGQRIALWSFRLAAEDLASVYHFPFLMSIRPQMFFAVHRLLPDLCIDRREWKMFCPACPYGPKRMRYSSVCENKIARTNAEDKINFTLLIPFIAQSAAS